MADEREVATVPRRPAIGRSWIAFVVGLAALLLGLLVGPRVPNDRQNEFGVFNVPLFGPFGVSLSIDSTDFMRFARDPSRLLEPHNIRQSRPGLILVAGVLTLPFYPMRYLVVWLGLRGERTDIEPQKMANSLLDNAPAYLPYIMLNVAALVLSFHFFRKICATVATRSDVATDLTVASIGLLIVANDVVKAFVWSPHTQMFNILVPIFGVYAVLRSWAGAARDRRFAVWMGLATGLGMTAYWVFAVLVPCLVLPALIDLVWRASPGERLRLIGNIGLFLVLAAAPMALWYVFVLASTGDFHASETRDNGMLIWMFDALSVGPGALAARLFDNAHVLINQAKPQAVAIAAAALLTLLAVIATAGRSLAVLRRAGGVVIAGLFVSALVLIFYTCVGWLVHRLAYAMLPPLIVAIGALAVAAVGELPPYGRRALASAYLVLVLAQMVFEVVKDGPWY